jgi:hypothetical protein
VEVLGYAALAVLALVVIVALVFVALAIPDMSRYRRLRKM